MAEVRPAEAEEGEAAEAGKDQSGNSDLSSPGTIRSAFL